MLPIKRFSPGRLTSLLHSAGGSPLAAGSVDYPPWYAHRWHFLPDGYLSSGSVALYDRLIRPLYHAAEERRTLAMVGSFIESRAARSIVELGSGPGQALTALSAALPSCTFTGIDLSPYMLERGERRLAARQVPAELIHADARWTGLPGNSADVVFAIHLLGHVPVDVAGDILAEAARLLRPGGRLLAVDHRWHDLPFARAGFRLTRERTCGAGFAAIRTLAVASPK